MASHMLSKNSIMAIPTAIQNMAKPHIFFIIHFVSQNTHSGVLSINICGSLPFSPQKKLRTAINANSSFFPYVLKSYALSTLPDFKQEVQTYNLFVAPFTLHLTDLMFGLNILLDLLCEWLTLLPKRTLFPQTEHLAIGTPPCVIKC